MICYILAMGKQHLGPHMVVGYGIKVFWPGLFIMSPDHLAKIKAPHKSLAVDCVRLNSLRGTKPLFLSPERYDMHTSLFYIPVCPPPLTQGRVLKLCSDVDNTNEQNDHSALLNYFNLAIINHFSVY